MIKIVIEIFKDKCWGNNALNKTEIKKLIMLCLNETIDRKQLKQIRNIFININFANEEIIIKNNLKYRNKHQSTNVLSFANSKNIQETISKIKTNHILYLGDMVLCYQQLLKEAIEYNIQFKDHLYHIFIHSILHLLGYDHIVEKERIEMENLEIKILKKINIPNPYIIG